MTTQKKRTKKKVVVDLTRSDVLKVAAAAVGSIDPSLEAAGRSLGAGRWTVFRRISLPLSLPGIQAGTILVFVLAMSAYVTPVMLGGAKV